LPPGTNGLFGGSSAGFVVTALNAASAASRDVWFYVSFHILVLGLHFLKTHTGRPHPTLGKVDSPDSTGATLLEKRMGPEVDLTPLTNWLCGGQLSSLFFDHIINIVVARGEAPGVGA
jgi:hypothetical protein